MTDFVCNAQEALEEWQKRLEEILANALLVGGIRIAVRCEIVKKEITFLTSIFDRRPETAEWNWVALSAGESPPPGFDWTIYEHRADIGWHGRTA